MCNSGGSIIVIFLSRPASVGRYSRQQHLDVLIPVLPRCTEYDARRYYSSIYTYMINDDTNDLTSNVERDPQNNRMAAATAVVLHEVYGML